MQQFTEKTLEPTESEFNAVVELFNGTRTAQGWSAMAPDDVFQIAMMWFRVLKQNDIEAEQYPALFRGAIAHRTAEIKEKKKPTSFTIELLLAMRNTSIPNQTDKPKYADRNAEMEARGFPKMTVVSEAAH